MCFENRISQIDKCEIILWADSEIVKLYIITIQISNINYIYTAVILSRIIFNLQLKICSPICSII